MESGEFVGTRKKEEEKKKKKKKNQSILTFNPPSSQPQEGVRR